MRIVSLFSGVGGLDLGFHRVFGDAAHTTHMCEIWEPARRVLKTRFPEAQLVDDVRDFRSVPKGTDLLTAGFPCTDLSQAGRTAGIQGEQSGLVARVFQALEGARKGKKHMPWLLLENVSNMLTLDGGKAMDYLVGELERLGYAWAYRTVDSRFTGVPQRRRRVILLASTQHSPQEVLFADEAGTPGVSRYRDDSFGFYWTEGERGLGWAVDAVPTLKGGSTIGIPSPPAIWIPSGEPGRKFLTPAVTDAEALQGFPQGWTEPGGDGRRDGARWKMVGNAVTVGVSAWVAHRIKTPGPVTADQGEMGSRWPSSAAGSAGQRVAVAASEYPLALPYVHLLELVNQDELKSLSERAARGFWTRLSRGNLGRHSGFRDDLLEHIQFLSEPEEVSA